jgi:hypothetical protein
MMGWKMRASTEEERRRIKTTRRDRARDSVG